MEVLMESQEAIKSAGSANGKSRAFLLAIPAVLVLGAAVITGSSWYVGKQVEEQYRQLITNADAFLRSLDSGSRLEIENYDRGLFSTKSTLRLMNIGNDEHKDVKIHNQIYHGPLPLNSFVPAIASIESRLPMPRELKATFDGENLLQGMLNISFDGELIGDYFIAKGQYSNHDGTFVFSPLNTQFRYSDKKQSGELTVRLDDVTVNADGSKLNLKEGEITVAFDPNSHYRHLGNGKLSLNLKQFNFITQQLADIALADLRISENLWVKGDRIEFEERGAIGKAVINGLNLGSFDRAVNLNVDAAVSDRLSETLIASLNNDYKIDVAKIEALVGELMYKKPQLSIPELTLKNDKGSVSLDGLIILDAKKQVEFENQEAVLKAISGSNVNFVLDRSYLEEAYKLFALLGGKSLSTATQEAQGFSEMVFNEAKANGGEYVEVKNDRLMFSFAAKDNNIVLNGKTLTQQEKNKLLFGATSATSIVENSFAGMSFDLEDANKEDREEFQTAIESTEKESREAEMKVAAEQETREAEMKAAAEQETHKAEMKVAAEQETSEVEIKTTVVRETQMPVTDLQVASVVSQDDSRVVIDPVCQIQQGDDAIAFLQACLRTKPSNQQVTAIIEQAKKAGVCDVAQRLYANRGQNDGDIALAYAREYDPQTANGNMCFNANKNTAVYWYETAVELGKTEAVKRLQELKK